MKLLCLPKIFRRRRFEAGGFTLLVSFLAFASAHAAERLVTDGDIERYLPRLRAEASAMKTAVQEALEATGAIVSAAAEKEKLYEDFSSGKTDVLEWLRAHTEYALVPAGAVYSAGCSRVITGDGAIPAAIFTFGKESAHRDLLNRATAGDSAALNEFHRRRGREETGERSAAAQAMYDLTVKTVSFYHDRGFVETEDLDRVAILTSLASPDRSVFVDIWEVNPYAGVLPRNILPPCAALPTGPVLEIKFTGELVIKSEGGPGEETAGAVAAEDSAGAAPAEAAPDPEYEQVKEALLLARMDAANPSALEIEIPPDAPPALKAELAVLKAEFEVRLANVAFYRRHEAVLAPILEALLGTAEQ